MTRIGGVFHNRMLKIFGVKSEELAADSKKTAYCGAARFLLFNKYYWSEQIMENEMGRACGTYRGESTPYRTLVEKPPERRSLARRRLTGEDNIKVDVKAIEWEG